MMMMMMTVFESNTEIEFVTSAYLLGIPGAENSENRLPDEAISHTISLPV